MCCLVLLIVLGICMNCYKCKTIQAHTLHRRTKIQVKQWINEWIECLMYTFRLTKQSGIDTKYN